jgi:hypothetical protein
MITLKKIIDNITFNGFEYGYELTKDKSIELRCCFCGSTLSIPFYFCSKRNRFICYACETDNKCSVTIPDKKNPEHIHDRIIKLQEE